MATAASVRPSILPGTGALPGKAKKSRRLSSGVLALLTALLLGGPMAGGGSDDADRGRIGWVTRGEEHLSLIGSIRPDRWRAVRYLDARQVQEYGETRSKDLRLEYLDLVADLGGSVVPASGPDVRRAVTLFRHNRRGALIWGELGRVEKPDGVLFYRSYRLGDEACFGFGGDFGEWADGLRERPGETLLGYGCTDTGDPLSSDRIELLLAGLGLRHAIVPEHVPSPPPARSAFDFARGSPDGERGVFAFPLPLRSGSGNNGRIAPVGPS